MTLMIIHESQTVITIGIAVFILFRITDKQNILPVILTLLNYTLTIIAINVNIVL